MANVDEGVFNEKNLYSCDVAGEDGSDKGSDKEGSEPEDDPSVPASSSNHPYVVPPPPPVVEICPRPSSKGASKPKRKKKKTDHVVFWLETKYDVLSELCNEFELWQEATDANDDLDLLWSDHAIPADRFTKMRTYQKVNHFVGMTSITRKNSLGRNLLRMKKRFQKEYRFFPDTWILPTDLADFKTQFTAKKNKTFIVKPDNGYQGKGIFLTRDFEKIPIDYSQTLVAQRYLSKPYLLDGHKFDLRLYVLVTGCDPLRIFLHEKGLVRLASEEYVEPRGKNLNNTMMHLTNYAINCDNPNFKENSNPEDGQDGHKRSVQAVYEVLASEGVDVDQLKADIEDLCIKTLIAVQPSLAHVYHSCQPDDVENSMCFEILGFDVMLDHKAKPWLIEVNHAPSFRTETELDYVVKRQVLFDAFTLLNLTPETKRRYKKESRQALEQRALGIQGKRSIDERMIMEENNARARTAWEEENCNGYKKLFPSEEKEEEYAQYLDAAIDIWETLTGGTSRRGIRLTKRQSDQAADAKDEKPVGAKRATGAAANKGDAAGSAGHREDRSSERLRSAVARLAKGETAKKRGSSTSDAEADAAPQSSATGSKEAPQETSKPWQSSSRMRLRPDVEIGDAVKVQTNLGWETVKVTKKYENSKLDIQFADGEIMHEVLPRILKSKEKPASGTDEPRPGSGAQMDSSPHSGASGSKESSGNATSSAAPRRPEGARSPPPPPPPHSGRAPGKRPQPSFVSQAVAALRAQQALGNPADSSPGGTPPEELPPNSSPRSSNSGMHGRAVRTAGYQPPRDVLTHFDKQLSKRIKQALGDPSLAAMRQHLAQSGTSLPLSVQGASATGSSADPRLSGSRTAAETRLRQQLNQLIHVRPILQPRAAGAQGRNSGVAEDAPLEAEGRSRSSAQASHHISGAAAADPIPSRSGMRSCNSL